MVAFTETFRYRLGKRLSRIPEPPVQPISLGFAVSILTTNSVEYEFSDGGSIEPSLLDEERTFYLQSPDVVLAPLTQHALARLLVPDETIPAMSLIQDLPTVSENLFKPLGKHATDGKHFKKDTPVVQQSLFADFGLETQKTEKIDGYRKSFFEKRAGHNHVTRKGADVWDLLLPLLQPPIDHNFVDILIQTT